MKTKATKRAIKKAPAKAKRSAKAKAATVLVLRTCDANMRSYGGFQWPRSGHVAAPDWNPAKVCGGGVSAPVATRWMASRRTAQGSIVHLWPDGALTWALGRYVEGSAQPKTPAQVSEAVAAGWLVMGDVELYDDEELPSLIAAARWAAKRGATPGEMRAKLHSRAALRPVWLTLEVDAVGRPVVQCWKLSRLRWPGLAIWKDHGRYSAWTEIGRSGTYQPTGCEFANLREVAAYLDTAAVPS